MEKSKGGTPFFALFAAAVAAGFFIFLLSNADLGLSDITRLMKQDDTPRRSQIALPQSGDVPRNTEGNPPPAVPAQPVQVPQGDESAPPVLPVSVAQPAPAVESNAVGFVPQAGAFNPYINTDANPTGSLSLIVYCIPLRDLAVHYAPQHGATTGGVYYASQVPHLYVYGTDPSEQWWIVEPPDTGSEKRYVWGLDCPLKYDYSGDNK